MRERNAAIDMAKFVASWLVVAIHTGLFSDISARLNFVVVHIICRLAVPFFAVCSGYFVGRSYQFGHSTNAEALNKRNFFRQWKKLAFMYAVWSAVYLFVSIPHWIEIGWFSAWAFVDYAVAVCTKGSYYHLWYLWGMVYVLPLIYAVLRWIPQKHWFTLTIVLWILKIFGYAYGFVLQFPVMGVLTVLSRFGVLLCLLPLMLLGVIISQKKSRSAGWYFIGFCVSFVLLFLEAVMLKNRGQDAVSYIFFTLPTAYFLFNCILSIHVKGTRGIVSHLAEISMFIYCVHPILINITGTFVKNSMFRFAICASGATALGYFFDLYKSKKGAKGS